MKKDIRETALYREAEALYQALRQPGTGQISDAVEVHVAPDGQHAVFAGTLVDKLEGTLPTRICRVDLTSGDMRILTFGPASDRLPKYSPDGRCVAFLSDRHSAGDFQLYLLDPISGAAQAAPPVKGWVEYLQWSPDGKRILLGVAGHGADISGAQGAITSKRKIAEAAPSWTPTVDTGDEGGRGRRVWVYEVAGNRMRLVGPEDANIWEASWCGNDAFAAVVSPGAGEGQWYSAHLRIVEIETGCSREIYRPEEQIGVLSASAGGAHLAVIEAICSDRGLVTGDLRLIDTASGEVHAIDTCGVDISYTEWRSAHTLLLAGHRGYESVVGVCDVATGTFTEVWSDLDISAGWPFICVSGFNEQGDCVLIGEGFIRAPEIAVIRHGEYRSVKSLNPGYVEHAKAIEAVECVSWQGADGLEIQGWLLRPEGKSPYPLIMNVHGGPVWHWRPTWLGRPRGVPLLMLLKRGYALFLPNPRGSSGRGRSFARRVRGEMGGSDTYDLLHGLDHLVETGIADPKRLGVMGVSYGGFMTSWLVTQDSRFAAAVSVAPINNFVTAHLLSNIPELYSMFLGDTYTNPGGKYFQRSPVMHAHHVKTPTLNVCGALDRCTPPDEAVQFHNALLANEVRSVLLSYPEEGHGVRRLPTAIDYAARVVGWFEEFLSARTAAGSRDAEMNERPDP